MGSRERRRERGERRERLEDICGCGVGKNGLGCLRNGQSRPRSNYILSFPSYASAGVFRRPP